MSAPVSGISIREFATRDGCNEKLVRRAIGNGRLSALPDGKLDPALVGTLWRKSAMHGADSKTADADTADTSDASADIGAAGDSRKPPTGLAPRESRPVAPLEAPPGELAPDEFAAAETFIRDVLNGKFASYADAERIKENGLALKHMLDGQRKAGLLIPLQAAQDAFFKAARDNRDAWAGWVGRVAVLAAAELGVEARRLTEVLNVHVHQHLTELGQPEFDPVYDRSEG